MNAHPEGDARSPRLNPFVFPSDTDFRFVLLVVSVLGASLFIYNFLHLIVAGDEILSRYERCQALAPSPDLLPASAFEAPTAYNAAAESYVECVAPVEARVAASMLGGVALLLGVDGAIYWLIPTWKIRRGRLVPLNEEDAPELVGCLADLCREAGLPRPPTFLLNPLSGARSGLAFGRLGRHYVVLNGGLAKQFDTDRPAFRAVVLHELAHLRNGDVNKTYLTVALWRAFVAVALIPLAAFFAVDLASNFFSVGPAADLFTVDLAGGSTREELYFVFSVGWRALALAAVVYLTRNAVLRAREVYADVRASAWEGAGGALGRVLGALPRPKASRFQSVLRVHPDPEVRLRTLEETGGLFRIGFWDAFGTGIAAAIALSNVDFLIGNFTNGAGIGAAIAPDLGFFGNVAGASVLFLGQALGAALIFAPLMVGVVGSGAWRATFAALAEGKAPDGAGRLGLALGLGVGVGQFLSFRGFDVGAEQGVPTGSAFSLGLDVLWVALLVAGLFFLLRWTMVAASLWIAGATTRRSLRLAYLSGLTVAAGILALWTGALSWADQGEDPLGALSLVVMNPLTLLALIVLWAFPLAAYLRRGQTASSSMPGWAFLDTSPQRPAWPRQIPCRLSLAVRAGLTGGLAFCALLLVVRVSWQLGVPEATREANGTRVMFYFGQVALAALMQAGVAAVVALRAKWLGNILGLFAAFVAGCVVSAGLLGLNLLFVGSIDLGFVWMVFDQVVVGGSLLALLSILGVATWRGLVHRFRRRNDEQETA